MKHQIIIINAIRWFCCFMFIFGLNKAYQNVVLGWTWNFPLYPTDPANIWNTHFVYPLIVFAICSFLASINTKQNTEVVISNAKLVVTQPEKVEEPKPKPAPKKLKAKKKLVKKKEKKLEEPSELQNFVNKMESEGE